jgi:hypothetical protein
MLTLQDHPSSTLVFSRVCIALYLSSHFVSSVSWCRLQFPCKSDVLFVCLQLDRVFYVICIYLRILVSNLISILDDFMMCKSNTTVVTSSTGISYSLWARKFTPPFWWCLCCRLVYNFLRSILPPMVYHLSRLFCHCIAIVSCDLRFLITHLVSSNLSWILSWNIYTL